MFHQIAIFVHHVELEMGHLAVKLPSFCTIVRVRTPHLANPTIKPRCYSGRGGGFYPQSNTLHHHLPLLPCGIITSVIYVGLVCRP